MGQCQDIEAVGGTARIPMLQRIGDFARGATDCTMSPQSGDLLIQLADSQVFALCQFDDDLLTALLRISQWDIGEWTVQGKSRDVRAQHGGEIAYAQLWMNKRLQPFIFIFGFTFRCADHRKYAWHYLH